MTTVMITGVGAIIGYGLLRSLRVTRPDVRVIGTDIYPDAVGQAWCNVFEQAPYTNSPQYLDWLQSMVEKYHVDLLMPGIEQDIHCYSDNRERIHQLNCKTMLNDSQLIDWSRDKWLMDQELAVHCNEVRIPSYLSGDYDSLSEKLGLPFILKPRKSYASKGLVRIHDRKDFNQYENQLGENLLAQPLVGSDDEEYTVAVFGDGQGNVCTSITLQRLLAKDGSTAKAWVRHINSLKPVVALLCSHFKPVGPTNLQFRRVGENWKLLEINPRVSSTTSIRTAFGYNEAEMSLAYYLEGKTPEQPEIRSGFATRFIEEYIVYDRDNF